MIPLDIPAALERQSQRCAPRAAATRPARRRKERRPDALVLTLNYSICGMLRGASFAAGGLAIVIGCATTEEYDPATFWVQVGAVVLLAGLVVGGWRLADWAARCEVRGGRGR